VNTTVKHRLALEDLEGADGFAGAKAVLTILAFAAGAADSIAAVITTFLAVAQGNAKALAIDAALARIEVTRNSTLVAIGRVVKQVCFAPPLVEPVAVAEAISAIDNGTALFDTIDIPIEDRLTDLAAFTTVGRV
jgi:hypothetical protein